MCEAKENHLASYKLFGNPKLDISDAAPQQHSKTNKNIQHSTHNTHLPPTTDPTPTTRNATQRNTQHATRNTQHATRNLQRNATRRDAAEHHTAQHCTTQDCTTPQVTPEHSGFVQARIAPTTRATPTNSSTHNRNKQQSHNSEAHVHCSNIQT